jgi:ABC-type uncharacterized transport system permease subunit
MPVKFGRKQIGNPIPASVSSIADFLAGFLGIISGFITTAAFIPANVSNIVTPIITALFIPLALYAKKFFGAQVESGERVDAGDVTEMKDSAIKP